MTLNPSHPPGSIADLSGLANRLADLDRRMKTLEAARGSGVTGAGLPDIAMGYAYATFVSNQYTATTIQHNLNAFPIIVVGKDWASNLFSGIICTGVQGYPDGNSALVQFESQNGSAISGTVHFGWVAFA